PNNSLIRAILSACIFSTRSSQNFFFINLTKNPKFGDYFGTFGDSLVREYLDPNQIMIRAILSACIFSTRSSQNFFFINLTKNPKFGDYFGTFGDSLVREYLDPNQIMIRAILSACIFSTRSSQLFWNFRRRSFSLEYLDPNQIMITVGKELYTGPTCLQDDLDAYHHGFGEEDEEDAAADAGDAECLRIRKSLAISSYDMIIKVAQFFSIWELWIGFKDTIRTIPLHVSEIASLANFKIAE
ncbi:hypothetical protein ACJX0J_009349, partial [Zea mays]